MKFFNFKVVTMFAFLAVLSACSLLGIDQNLDKAFDISYVKANFKAGKITKAQVIDALGTPDAQDNTPTGSSITYYNTGHQNKKTGLGFDLNSVTGVADSIGSLAGVDTSLVHKGADLANKAQDAASAVQQAKAKFANSNLMEITFNFNQKDVLVSYKTK